MLVTFSFATIIRSFILAIVLIFFVCKISKSSGENRAIYSWYKFGFGLFSIGFCLISAGTC